MMYCRTLWPGLPILFWFNLAAAAPIIDVLPNVNVPAGKSLTLGITASSANNRPLTYTISSSTNRLAVEQHTNNPFWKMSVVQTAPANAPGAFLTPFRGGLVSVTNVGEMTFMLLRDRAPRTVDAIAALTTSGFYNSNTIFHRVVLDPYFIIQGGDPNTNGSGGPVFQYDDEFHSRSLYTGTGQLGCANSGTDTSGSQFFITASPQRGFDLRYTIFGQLLRGYNVMSNVLHTPVNANSRPLADVIITRASLVPNYTDTVITLTASNLVGVSATIQVIADDGSAGGRTTNSFIATTVSEPFNSPPILNTPAISNLFIPLNGRSTNVISAFDLEANQLYYRVAYADFNAFFNSSVTDFNATTGQFTIVPAPGYFGRLSYYLDVSQYTNFALFDSQLVTFAVGDTALFAVATNFSAKPATGFTNQLLAVFTNGFPASPANNFAAQINWGDNSTSNATIATNSSGGKEVRGSHLYNNSGSYPIYVTIYSALGAETTVIAAAHVQPVISLNRDGSNNILRWPAWAAQYQLQFQTNPATSTWSQTSDFPTLSGYEIVVTNTAVANQGFFRLKR